jgi:hypothetical protein
MDLNENEQKKEVGGLDEKSTLHLENKVKELHANVRHITQLGMSWFAFFVTINYFTIGWLAKGPISEKPSPDIIWIVALVFIVQNGLGIIGICMVGKETKAKAKLVETYENLLLKAYNTSNKKVFERASIPAKLYINIAWFLMAVLFSLILAWTGIWCYYSK